MSDSATFQYCCERLIVLHLRTNFISRIQLTLGYCPYIVCFFVCWLFFCLPSLHKIRRIRKLHNVCLIIVQSSHCCEWAIHGSFICKSVCLPNEPLSLPSLLYLPSVLSLSWIATLCAHTRSLHSQCCRDAAEIYVVAWQNVMLPKMIHHLKGSISVRREDLQRQKCRVLSTQRWRIFLMWFPEEQEGVFFMSLEFLG